ncbi:MAG: HEAT repeat domain-containing protein [Planctomycetes bacterium]|nr:HEAT repeat domain-containing protein [Planctomycetota bacterium]
MKAGLSKTFEFLSQTENEAAVDLLLRALESPTQHIQHAALRALLERRSVAGQLYLVRRWHTLPVDWLTILDEHRGRMTQALRDAVLDADPQVCDNGCQAALRFREYDLIPTLLNAADEPANPNADRCAATLLSLTELLYEELYSPPDIRLRRDPQMVRRHVAVSLEQSLDRAGHAHRDEIVEAFLLIAGRDNSVLLKKLSDPLDPCYRQLINMLTHSGRLAVMRLVLSYLEDSQAPSAMLGVISHRTDRRFVELLLRKIGAEPTPAARHGLKRMNGFAWLRDDDQLFKQLDEAGQFSAVKLMTSSGMKPAAVYDWLVKIADTGNVGGRRAALLALENYPGAEANQLVLRGLRDTDPLVQAAAAGQLRQRNIPQALSLLVELIDSPHQAVRQASRDSLAEFNFARFLSAFDMLDDEVRRSTGVLVKRVDVRALASLRQELQNASGKRRMRALNVSRFMQAVPQVEETIIELLMGDDHLVRSEAAAALADSDSDLARAALNDALNDTSLTVQESAAESLRQISARGTPKIVLTMPPAPAATEART